MQCFGGVWSLEFCDLEWWGQVSRSGGIARRRQDMPRLPFAVLLSSCRLSISCNHRLVLARIHKYKTIQTELNGSVCGHHSVANYLHSVSSRCGPRSCMLHGLFCYQRPCSLRMSPSCSPVTAVVLAVHSHSRVEASVRCLLLKEFSGR